MTQCGLCSAAWCYAHVRTHVLSHISAIVACALCTLDVGTSVTAIVAHVLVGGLIGAVRLCRCHQFAVQAQAAHALLCTCCVHQVEQLRLPTCRQGKKGGTGGWDE